MTAGSRRVETVSLAIGIAVVLLITSIGLLSAGVAADTTGGAAEPIDDAAKSTTVAPTYELEIDNDGSAAAIGFPGSVDGTVDDLFVEDTDGVSAVYRYSAADNAWNNVLAEDGADDFDDVSADPMDSLVILTTGQDGPETIPLEITLETEAGETVTPGERDVEAGWNFVSAPQHTDADTVFGAGTANTSLVLERYDGPRTVAVEQTPEFGEYYLDSGQPPTTDPFSGYFVFAQEDGTIPIVASGITDRDDADAQLALPTIDEVTVRGDITSGAEDGSLADGDLTVRLDGEEIDTTDGEYEETLAPGEYTVTVEADGHQTTTRELDARFATTYEEDVELEGAVVTQDGEKSYVSAAAAAEDAGDGATISLESGTFEENIEITADGVTIEGASGVSLVSTASKTGETTVVGDIDIDSDGVTIRDLSVHDGTVSAGSSDDLALSGLDIIGETGTADPGVNSAGIEVEGGTNLSITNVAIEADRGISVSGVQNADMHGIDVATDDGIGFVLYDATGVDLDRVTVDGADQAVGLVNVADSTVGNIAIEDSTLGLAVGNESGSQTTPGNLTLMDTLELDATIPYAEITEGDAEPVEIDRPDGLTHTIQTEPVSGVPVSVTGFAYTEANAIAGAVALTDASGGQPLAEASAVQRLSDDVYVVASETSLQDATDIADEDAMIEVRGGTHEEGATIETDGITITGEDATFEETIVVDGTQGVTVDAVTVTDATDGIVVLDSTDTTLTGVDTSGNSNLGMIALGSEDVEISGATSSDNEFGLLNVQDDTSVSVVNSTFNGNEEGILNDGDGIVTVRNSTIVGNHDGALNMGGATLDAAENWWGDASGPSGDADGTGDSVIGNVDYEPWLDAPPGDEPGGIEDAGVELSNFETDTTAADRGDTVTTSVDVTNAVESVGFSTMAIDDGAELEVEYVLVDGTDEESIATETVNVVTGETKTVEFAESLPGSTTAHEERSVEHEIKIAGEGVGERADLELANPIQTALEFADSEDANTVDVESGTYDETVDLAVDGLMVTGPADGIATITNDATPMTVSGTGTAVEGLTIESTDLYSAVEIAGSATDVTVADNAIAGGINVATNDENLEGVTIEGNEIDASENNGVLASVSGDGAVIDGLEIVDNAFEAYHQNAIEVYSSSGGEFTAPVEISGNEIVAEDIFESDGIYVHASIEHVSIEHNEIRHAQSSAINVQGAADEITVRQNTIADNENGIKLYGSGTLDATENWWGDASGPSGEGDGTGDAIEVGDYASVDYAPWLDGPIPDGEPVVGDAAGRVTASGDTSEADAGTNAITAMQTPGTNEPVADATVTVYPFDPDASGDETLEPITVDANGDYSVEDLPVGTHGFVAEADGFASEVKEVTVNDDDTTTTDFHLEYAGGGTVSGTVSLDEVDPAEDVTVTVALEETDDETTTFLAADTDNAAFIIDDVAVDVDDGYTVTATADSANYGDAVQDAVTVDVGETVDIDDLALERDTGGAEGTVTASGDTASSGGASTNAMSTMTTPGAGENVDDATVTVHYFDTDANGDGDVTVDVTDGSFSVDQLPVGTHGFAVEGSGLESDTRDETIEDGSTTENVDFDLDYAEAGTLSGSISIPELADGDFPVDVAVLDGEDEVASEEVTIADGDSSAAYTFENVDVNVDDGYTVSATTDAFESAPEQENVIVDVEGETTGVDIALTDPVAQRVDVDASDTTTTVGEWVAFTATVTNDAGTPIEGVTVESTHDGEDVDYRNGESSQTTNEGGEASFEATTETEQQFDGRDNSIQFTFTEQDNENEGIEHRVEFEADEIHTFSVEDDTLDGAPYVNIEVIAEDQYGNDVNFDVQVEVSGFDDLTEPCSDSCTETSSPIKFETDALQDSGTAEFTETNSGMTDSLDFTIERV